MKKLKSLVILALTLSMMMAGMAVTTSADTTTDLKSMTVYAVDASGKKTELSMDFNSTTYTYDLTTTSDTVSISIEATVVDSTSKWGIEKDGINTKMDEGLNKTVVDVTSATGVVNKYTLNTTKLKEGETLPDGDNAGSTQNSSNVTSKGEGSAIKVGKTEFKIATSFKKSSIPEGFTKTTDKYNGTKYPCIKGDKKDITAYYLYNDKSEGFYIYDTAKKEFYEMHNINIKSRMYTIVTPKNIDSCLKNYDKKNITIIDQKVNAWVLDSEEGIYLVYAMNWNGDTNLYTYDDSEKCFQRYILSEDVNTQMDAANKAYNNMQEKYNSLVDRYNIMLKVLCGLVVIIIILIFVAINLGLNKKAKKIKKNSGNNRYSEDSNEQEAPKPRKKKRLDDTGEIPQEDAIIEPQPVIQTVHPNEPKVDKKDLKDDSEQKDDDFIFNLDEDETEDNAVENEQPEDSKQQEIENKTEEARKEAEEDLKETLKSMLPDEDEDDDDFEFIDLD